MKVAFSVWDNRIAPVFDVARLLHIVHSEAGRIVGESDETIVNDGPTQRALHLVELGVSTLICGGISRQLLRAISAYGICVIPFIAGDLQEVIQAQLAGTILREEYSMPGCRRRRQRSGCAESSGSSRTSRRGRRK